MQATSRLEIMLGIGERESETARGSDERITRSAMLAEVPGLVIAMATLFYLISSLTGLM